MEYICIAIYHKASELKNALVVKSMEKAIFGHWYELWDNLFIREDNFNKIKVSLMGYWKSSIILKEIKKPGDKFCAFCLKTINLRFEIFEKTLKFTYENLNGKLIFYRFSIPSSRPVVILYSLEINIIFLLQFFSISYLGIFTLRPPLNLAAQNT